MNVHQRYIDHIKNAFENENEITEFLEYCQRPLKKSIKINTSKIPSEKFKKIISDWQWTLTDPGFIKDNDDIYYIDREDTSLALGRTFLHQSGFFYMQEIAASMPVKFLNIKEGDVVLDVSSAPGGKSVQIGDKLLNLSKSNPGFVVSNDVSSTRLIALAHNLNRMGIYNSGITKFNGFSFGKNIPEFFDHVLVDAPCSGEGTGFKSDFALKFWKKEEINKIAGTQFQLLVSAIKATKPGGSIIFSTCTMNPYENEFNIKKILEFFNGSVSLENVEIIGKSSGLQKFDDLELLSKENADKLARFWPHIQKTGGFFVSKFIKHESTFKDRKIESKLYPFNQFKIDISKSLQTRVIDYLNKNYRINLDPKHYLFAATKEQVYVTSPKFLEIKDKLHFEKFGTPIFKLNRDETFRPTHHLGNIFGHLAQKNFIVVDENIANKYASGKDLEMNELLDANIQDSEYPMIKWNEYGIGQAKIVNGSIKNKYIK